MLNHFAQLTGTHTRLIGCVMVMLDLHQLRQSQRSRKSSDVFRTNTISWANTQLSSSVEYLLKPCSQTDVINVVLWAAVARLSMYFQPYIFHVGVKILQRDISFRSLNALLRVEMFSECQMFQFNNIFKNPWCKKC